MDIFPMRDSVAVNLTFRLVVDSLNRSALLNMFFTNLKEKINQMRKNSRPPLEAILKNMSNNGHIPCRQIFDLARETDHTPYHLGEVMDASQLRISKCQLGLFGFGKIKKIIRPAKTISLPLKTAIEDASNDSRLECRSAWEIAQRLKLSRISVSEACESMGIKVSHCQLGAF
jgi:hypothetical protein